MVRYESLWLRGALRGRTYLRGQVQGARTKLYTVAQRNRLGTIPIIRPKIRQRFYGLADIKGQGVNIVDFEPRLELLYCLTRCTPSRSETGLQLPDGSKKYNNHFQTGTELRLSCCINTLCIKPT